MNAIKRSSLGAIAILLIAAQASASLAATPSFPVYSGPPSKTNPVVKPGSIDYVGDGSEFFAGPGGKTAGKLHWSVWNSNEGLGTGYQWIDNCIPSCANGKFAKYPITLKVYRPRQTSKYLIFTRLTVTYTGKKPGHQKTFTWNISYQRGAFQIG